MAGKKESVYITLNTEGIDEAVEKLNKLTGPLENIALLGSNSAGKNDGIKAITDGLKDIQSSIDSLKRMMGIKGLIGFLMHGLGVGSGSLSNSLKVLQALPTSFNNLSLAAANAGNSVKIVGANLALAAATAQKSIGALQASSIALPASLSSITTGLGNSAGALSRTAVATGLQTSLKSLIPVVKGATLGVKDLALGFASAHKVMLGAAAGATAVAAGLYYYIKANHESMKVYDKLNPEAETYSRTIAATDKELKAVAMTSESLFGETWAKQWTPVVNEFSKEWITLRTNITKTWTTIWEGGRVLEMFGQELKRQFYSILGTTLQSLQSVLPESVSKFLNIDYGINQAIAGLKNASKEFDAAFNGSTTGSRWKEQYKKALGVIDAEDAANKGKEVGKAFEQGFNVVFDWMLIGDKFYNIDIANKLAKLKDDFENQMASIESISGSESLKNDLRLKLEQEYLAKQHDLEIENAKRTGNDLLIVQDQYDQIKKQKEQESLIAFQELQAEMAAAEKARLEELQRQQAELDKQRNDYIRMFTDNIQGTLTSSVTSFFDAALEGNADLRKSSFEMLSSLAKNIFNMGITKLITYAFEAMMRQYEANSKFGLPGLAIATAASGALAGIMAGMKAKLAPAKIQYSTGGYISAGMVKGAYSSNDSVEALLQPGERVLSKEETKAYDEGFANNRPINFYFTFNGQLQTQAQIDQFTRQVFVPSLRRAAIAGYKV